MLARDPGWIELSHKYFDQDEDLRWELTVITEENERIELFQRHKDCVLVPRGLWRRLRDQGKVDDTPPGALPERRLNLKALAKPLYADQVTACDVIEERLRDQFGTILEAHCGTGKTVMGMDMIRRLNTPTCVLVHKEFLMDQWQERIAEFMPEAKVGIWRQGRFDSGETHDVVIAMIQSLIGKRQYPSEQFASFGFVCGDEVHRQAAPQWQRAIVKFPALYRLGLTATPDRRDGMQIVFFSHIGRIGYRLPTKPEKPKVHKIALKTLVPKKDYIQQWDGKANTSKLISILANNNSRTDVILGYLVRAVSAGRKILVLTERLTHVSHMIDEGVRRCSEDTVFAKYVGGMSKAARKKAEKADVIVGTYQMAQEGLDIPDLDTLFLATPKTSITQPVGRILRDFPGKKSPMVIDFADEKIPVLKAYWFSRRKKYVALGYLPN